MQDQLFNIAVCDDEQMDKEEIAEMTRKVCEEEKILTDMACYESGKELLQDMQEGKSFDLLLLDVMMPGLDGMELARFLREERKEVSIVFISNNREMALQGYEVSAARYLAKPLQEERLREAIKFCCGKKEKNKQLLLPVNGTVRKANAEEIYYLEIVGRKTRIAEKTEEWDTTLPMNEVEKMVSDLGFIRCHKSFLVNCRYIRTLTTSSVELANGRYIPVSKHRIKEVREAFFSYMNQ